MDLASKFARDFATVPDMVREHAAEAPDRLASIQGDIELTYGQFDAMADRVAAALQRDGCAPREAIAVAAGTSIPYLVTFLGALRAGLAVAPLSPSATPDSLAAMIQDSGARILFTDAATADHLGPRENLPQVALDGSGAGPRFADWLAPEGAKPADVPIAPDWAFNIIYSSGTTGTPKGIVQSHAMRWAHVNRGPVFGYGPDTVTLISTPLYSNTTLVSVFPALSCGGALVLMEKFSPAEFLALAERHRVTHAMLVPVQYRRLMAAPDFDRYDLSAFRMKFSTSAPFSAELKADVLKRWPGGLVEYYGMTEGGGTCILVAHEFPDKLHTVGRPGEGHDIRLIDEAGHEVAPGETGEVVGRSSAMMHGYKDQPAKTAEAEWYDAEGRRFIRTGDVGRFDPDGFLVLLDRRKDMIISGGFNIYPSDLEAVLSAHPDVGEASVVGVPSEAWGETPVAFVVPRSGASVSAAGLMEWANAQLGKMQRLAAVELIDALPRSSIGKVLKRELRDTVRVLPQAHASAPRQRAS